MTKPIGHLGMPCFVGVHELCAAGQCACPCHKEAKQ